jgi:hypothetical protein
MVYIFSPDGLAVFIFLVVLLVIWEMVWKGIALWRAGRNNQVAWYVVIFILNTLGILPIIYLAFFQKNRNPVRTERIVERKPTQRAGRR